MLLRGVEFKDKYSHKKFFKLTTESECHNGFQFKNGLNIDTVKFNPTGRCQAGGLYFTDYENISKWISYRNYIMYWIREVVILDNSQIYIEDSKFKADFFYLENRKKIWDDYELCKLAVQQDRLVLQYVKDKTDEICRLAT